MDDKSTAEQNRIIKALMRFKEEDVPNPAFTGALVDAIVYEVAKGSLFLFIQNNPDVIMKFIGICLGKLTDAYCILDQFVTKNLEQRVGLTLLRLAENLGEASGEGKNHHIPISIRDLSIIVANSQEAIYRVMVKLEQESVLSISENRITIIDFNRLKKIASELKK